MPIDFRASQLQTNKIIASGSTGTGTGAQILVYSHLADDGTSPNQGFIDQNVFDTSNGIGTDIFLFVSGGIGERFVGGAKSISVFGGDLHVSGNLTVGGTYPAGGGGSNFFWSPSNPFIEASGSLTITGSGYFKKGLTGSLQQVSPGVPYLLAGPNITLATNSLGQVSITGSASGGGGSSFYRLEVLDYYATNNINTTTAGQVIFPANQFTGSLVLYGVIANSSATATGSIRLYNVTSGSYVHIGGPGNQYLSVSGVNPTIVSSVNLISASNFNSSSQAIYELQVSSSNGGSTAFFGGFELRPSGSFTGVTYMTSSTYYTYVSGTWEDGGNKLATTSSVAVTGLQGPGFFANNVGSDVFFYVSGNNGGVSAGNGVAVFGGDVVISGVLYGGSPLKISGSVQQGYQSSATGNYSFAQGVQTIASQNAAHSEGDNTQANGQSSHAEGQLSVANGQASHAEGYNTLANAQYSHSEGQSTITLGYASHTEGNATQTTNNFAHAEGDSTVASGQAAHAEGYQSQASGFYSHGEGHQTNASGLSAHAEGYKSSATGNYSHSEGEQTKTGGASSHSEGYGTYTNNQWAHAEGYLTTASANFSHTEGYNTITYGNGSHAEGDTTVATGAFSHAEGGATQTIGPGSHAEGGNTLAYGTGSHSEGGFNLAEGDYSHAEGGFTKAYGIISHAEGYFTVASGAIQHVQGKYNKRGNDFSLFVIGDGTDDNDTDRSDIVRVNSGSTGGTGIVEITGSLSVSGSGGNNGTLNQYNGLRYYPTIVTSLPHTASLNDYIIAISASAGAGIELPVSDFGRTFIVKDVSGSAASDNIIVTAAGALIDGSPSATIAIDYGSAKFIYFGSGIGWGVV